MGIYLGVITYLLLGLLIIGYIVVLKLCKDDEVEERTQLEMEEVEEVV